MTVGHVARRLDWASTKCHVWTLRKHQINQIKYASRSRNINKAPLLKNLPDPPFVNLMQAEITSDDSIIPHHYEHQNMPGRRLASGQCWCSLGNGMIWITNRPCPPCFLELGVHSVDQMHHAAAAAQ